MKNIVICLLVFTSISTIPVLAFGPTNVRLHGFGGAGIAIAPREGQTAMAVNPAAPGFMEQRQFMLNINYGEQDTTGRDFSYSGYVADYAAVSGGMEGFFPLGPVTLFGGLGADSESKDWWIRDYLGSTVLRGQRHDTSFIGRVGLAGSYGDVVAFGGQLLAWNRSLRDDAPRAGAYDETHKVYSGEAGLLVVTPAEFNFGLTFQTEDSDGNSIRNERVTGISRAIRAGAAYQKKNGRWLAGAEYVHEDEIDLEGPVGVYLRHGEDLYLGEELFHVYGEYWFGRVGVRAGVCRSEIDRQRTTIFGQDIDAHDLLVVSFGCSGRITETTGWDLFIQRAKGDGGNTGEGRGYDYETEFWVFGFGVTFMN